MIVNKVERKAEFNKLDLVKYQLITYCYFQKITISDAAATCFAKLCLSGKSELNKFCQQMSDDKLFASPQVVRNTICKGEEKNLVIKEGKERKVISINPDIKIQHEGTVLLDFKFLSRESL